LAILLTFSSKTYLFVILLSAESDAILNLDALFLSGVMLYEVLTLALLLVRGAAPP
jgi:hypothetical protein